MSSRSARRQADKIARHQGKEKAGTGKKFLWAGLGLLAFILIPVALLAWWVSGLTSTFDRETVTLPEAFPDEQSRPAERDDGAQTILLLGSDTRSEVNEDALEAAQDGRSDTMMVMRIPADRKAVYIVSIMRDSWVDIPGYGDNKINAAFAYGGVPLAVQTVENLLDTRIDHVAVIDFNGFRGLTNALGGVTVNNTVAFSAGGFQFDKGPIKLNGEEALVFVRQRKPFADGDYQRVRNQQAYMRGLLSELISRDTLTSPGKISNSVTAIAPYLSVDHDLDSGYVIRLAPELRNIRPDNIYFLALPTEGVGWSPDGKQSIIILDPAGVERFRQAFHDDDMSSLV